MPSLPEPDLPSFPEDEVMNHDLHKVLAEEVSLLVGEGVQHDLHKVLAEEVSHSASGGGGAA